MTEDEQIGSQSTSGGPLEEAAEREAPQRDDVVASKLHVVTSWDEVPFCDSEEAEAAFWEANRLDLRLMEQSVAPSPGITDSVTVTLRMGPRMLARIKRLARSRYLNYQSMIKQWISERMEKELKDRDY